MEYIQLTGEYCVYQYGVIQNPGNKNILLKHSLQQKLKSFIVVIDQTIVTVLNIQGEFVYIKGKFQQGIQEYNENLRMLSDNQTARWRFKEVEYKFNILHDMEDFFLQFSSLKLPGFSITYLPQYFNSIETMYYLYPECYFSLLRWEDEEEYNAIKIKKTISKLPILTRDTIIVDYTPHQFLSVLNLFHTSTEKWERYSATFHKRKERHIAIDYKSGHIFGISCNISQINSIYFCQVELEYWSRIFPCKSFSDNIPNFNDKEQLQSHFRLIASMNEYLQKNNIQFNNIQLAKNVWIQNIVTSHMK